ncbi:MAG: DsbE family thiol:disulfide interchange protein [Alphaproteobacteria bacterium]|nr:DsbE family thiol:disulfide interchange protein [Alphaproteobacteria bacterium]
MLSSGDRKKGWNFLFAVPVIFFFFLLFVFYLRLDKGPGIIFSPSVLIGHPVSAFTLPALEGLVDREGRPVPGFSSADLKRGEVRLVNIWASWCPPCRKEHPLLQKLSDEGVVIYGLNYKDSSANALTFLKNFGSPFEKVGVDERGTTIIDWGVFGLPETFLVRGDGVVIYKHTGALLPGTVTHILKKVRNVLP